MDTTAKNATGTGAPLMSTATSAGSVMRAAMSAVNMTPFAGTRLLVRCDHSFQPGTARSRLKANSIREELVMQATVQKNWPTVEMSSTMATHEELMAWLKMTATPPPPLDTPAGSCTANRKANKRIQPPMAEYKM